jgi:beta-1,4-mannosyl-glycoprotein beta-1,4-N-acetylglucosaminyltransferase
MRIFDTFPFDGELDLLEHRLRETYDLVDAFILVEAAQTYSGQPKELTFSQHRERFAWASAKLRPITLDALGGNERSARERAAIQRDAIRLALRDAAPEDVVLLCDVDEVPSPQLLRELRVRGMDTPRRILMTRHHQHADVLAPHSPCCPSDEVPLSYRHPGSWDDVRWESASAVAVPFSALAARSAFDLRFSEIEAAPLPNGGRHFSSVDPSTQLERKLHRVFHTEWAGTRETSPAHLALCCAHGVHHRGWWFAERPSGAIPEDVARLMARLRATETSFPPLWRRRIVRSWAALRLQRWMPDAIVSAIDRVFTLRRR